MACNCDSNDNFSRCEIPTGCFTSINTNDIVTNLAYYYGLDADGCWKFQLPTVPSPTPYRSCTGQPIDVLLDRILLCNQLQAQIQSLPVGNPVVYDTDLLLGSDGQFHLITSPPPSPITNTLSITAGLVTSTVNGVVAVAPLPPETPITPIDTASINLAVSGISSHTLSAQLIVSPNAGNALSVLGNGVFVPTVVETPIQVNDTSSINLTASGIANHIISADLRLSNNVGNQATIVADGLFVAPTIVPPETPLTANDSSSIDFTASGVANHTLTGSVRISASLGNNLIINPDGLFVPPVAIPSETPITVNDSNTIDFTASGVANHTITGVVRVSANAGNNLSVVLDGLFVNPETSLTVIDSNSIDLTVSGVASHTLTGTLRVSANIGNQLSILPDGVFVPPPQTACNLFQNIANVAPITALIGKDSTGCPTQFVIDGSCDILRPYSTRGIGYLNNGTLGNIQYRERYNHAIMV